MLHVKDLIQALATLIDQLDDFKLIDTKLKFQRDFTDVLLHQPINAVLRQKLTVMSLRRPALFKQTLLGAWLAVLIARELSLPDVVMHRVGIAALARDVGLLHLAPDLLEKQGGFTPQEWRAMQSHVIISQLIAVDAADMHPDIALAVLEHHERLDGTGYPTGKEGADLGLPGQILSMAEALHALRFKRFSVTGHTLGHVQPFLLMNSLCYHRAVYDAICAVLSKAELDHTPINPHGDQHSLLTHLVQRAKHIQHTLPALNRLLMLLQSLKPNAQTRELTKLITLSHTVNISSGIINNEIVSWLETLMQTSQPTEIPFLCEMELLQNELLWHLNRVRHRLDSFLYDNQDLAAPVRGELTHLVDTLGALKMFETSQTLG